MTDTPQCPIHGCACTTAYRTHRCRCDACRAKKKQDNRKHYTKLAESIHADISGEASQSLFDLLSDESAQSTPERHVEGRLIRSLDDLVAHLQLDLDEVEVKRFWVKSMKDGEVFNVSAQIEPLAPLSNVAVIEHIWKTFIDDAAEHSAPDYAPVKRHAIERGTEKMLEIAIVDPHLGMLAWGKECGVPYDLEIGENDYRAAFTHLLSTASYYSGIEQITMLVGNDLLHVDGPGFDAKGGTRGGATSAGTMQDFDTRLARLFTHVRKLLVDCIDQARLVAPVRVQIVPGNHDRHSMYKMGEVLSAWYRHDREVVIANSPAKRDYFAYGANLFMVTHGEEFKRKRDPLITVFATECPPELWVRGKVREIHVGHNHINLEKVYVGDPAENIYEARGVRVRSLPGLTPEDSWHSENGYKHGRRATALIWRKEGGLVGLHEYTM